jgi:hypothetical protein
MALFDEAYLPSIQNKSVKRFSLFTLTHGGVGQAAVEFLPSASTLRDRRRTLV